MRTSLPNNLTTQQRLQLIRRAEAVIAQDPRNADSYFNIGVLMSQDKHYREAAKNFQKALSIRKKDPATLENLAHALASNGEYRSAIKYARKLCEITPRNARSLSIYADVQEEAGNTAQAAILLEKADRLDPDNVGILGQLAECLKKMGKMEESDLVFERIRKIDPYNVDALLRYSSINKFDKESAELISVDLFQAIENSDDESDKSGLYFSAGKVFQDCKEYDQAFEYFSKANDLSYPGDDPTIYNEIQNARAAFTKNFFSQRTDFGVSSYKPIFILGMPRSGTTLTESICGAHTKIIAGDEQIYMPLLARSLGMAGSVDLFIKTMNEMPKDVSVLKAEEYLEKMKEVTGKTDFFTDKLPHNFIRFGLIKLLFPSTKIIHCRRHPIDNCLSLFTNSMNIYHRTYKGHQKTLGLYYRQYLQLMQHWREVFPDQFHEVYYEDVVTNTELNARQMIEYLGFEWEDSVMDRQSSQKSVKTLSAWQVRQPVYTTSAGRWRNYEKHLGPLIDTLGPVVQEYEDELAAIDTGQS